jgi:hypothetical protein
MSMVAYSILKEVLKYDECGWSDSSRCWIQFFICKMQMKLSPLCLQQILHLVLHLAYPPLL